MRADRLVSLVLLLRRHGRLSATTLARHLEVSTRTVLRDIDALSAAGVPVYAERGRNGGFTLLPGFHTELTGLTHDEALALLIAGSRRGTPTLGLGSALASAMLKVVDALPDTHRNAATDVTRRLLIDPDTDLLARRTTPPEPPDDTLAEIRTAVFSGHKLRIHYAAHGHKPRWRTIDPIGLVTVRDHTYLLATRDGEDRTYRLSRVRAARHLDEPAQRPDHVDLDRAWHDRGTRFRAGDNQVTVRLRLHPDHRETLLTTAVAVHTEHTGPDDWLHLTVTFQDHRHARWALWQHSTHAEALHPQWLRDALHHQATVTADLYAPTRTPPHPDGRSSNTHRPPLGPEIDATTPRADDTGPDTTSPSHRDTRTNADSRSSTAKNTPHPAPEPPSPAHPATTRDSPARDDENNPPGTDSHPSSRTQ
ncbi:Predicted DNA-binding transcriptional regulator YafY, contains an HTH and WYL domains [Lentzea fradiae]|uniref:Predicted DNA-binding transcriptional regulator YafY, contains an HTH and WYL domains n=1 Tax=Lentzea fradiae TaxID=200378 RepID=A0A1G7W4U4_9PSEU|nr:Predicted DNA-binding transcriptional regulator YafY, contains an HTH and WYL domains [Lentzea fradiae]